MSFCARVSDNITIGDTHFRLTEHPHAPGMPYGQEGRQATVYQLTSESAPMALKVFKPRYRLPSLVRLADQLAPFASIPGLSVCKRTVLTPQNHETLLKDHPDLTYAVLMPWIEGPTWMEMVLGKRALTQEQTGLLGRSLAEVLSYLEQQRIAHCDLSGPNVILPGLAITGGQPQVVLVDVEQMYGPGLDRPEALPGGSPGYAHSSAHDGLWQPDADRFAGAVLIAEMLGWSDERVRSAAWGESFFEPGDEGTDCERARLLTRVLSQNWGETIAALFSRAWGSASLSDCPTFGEWLLAIPKQVTFMTGGDAQPVRDVSSLLLRAGQLEVAGDLLGAADAYEQVLQGLADDGSLHREVTQILARLRAALEQERKQEATAIQAKKLETEGRWKEAALIYDGLLAEKAGSPGQRATWEEAVRRCREEADLAGLFDTATKLRDQGQEKAARELLVEVVRRRPEYERSGRKATELLTGGNKREGGFRVRAPRWSIVLAAVMVLALLLGAGAMFQAQYQASSQAGTATAQEAAETTASALAEATKTAELAAARSATASAGGTATASAQASATTEAIIGAENQAATGTAVAQAVRATAGAAQAALQAQATQQAANAQATAQAAGRMAAQATSQAQQAAAQATASAQQAAQAQAAATQQAQQTASAQAAQATYQAQERASAQAQSGTATAQAVAAQAAGTAQARALISYPPSFYADLGNVSSESAFSLEGWSGAQGPPMNGLVSPSGDRTKRFLNLDDSSLTFYPVEAGHSYRITAEVEDAGCTDSFQIVVNSKVVYSFTGHHNQANATVRSHVVTISGNDVVSDHFRLTFRHTSPDCGLAPVFNVRLDRLP